MSVVRHAAFQREQALRTLLDEDDDEYEDRYLREYRARPAFEHLVEHAEPETRIHGAGELSDAAEHHHHERVDDVRLAEIGADVADLRKRATRETRDARAHAECEHVHARRRD